MPKQLQDYEADEIHTLLEDLQTRAEQEGEEDLCDKIASLLPLVDTDVKHENI